MPKYLQLFTTPREFYGYLEKIIDSSIQLQKEYAENASIETSIPKEYAEIIQSIGKNSLNQIIYKIKLLYWYQKFQAIIYKIKIVLLN